MVFKLSPREKSALAHHKILIGELFDAEGLDPAKWKPAAKLDEKLFVVASPCRTCGIRIRDRENHCVDCNPSCVSFIRRAHSKGQVYIAATRSGRLYKVGCGTNAMLRQDKLRSDGYAGFNDWAVVAWARCEQMQKVEFEIHKRLEPFAITKDYTRGSREYQANELFQTSLAIVWRAYAEVTKDVPLGDKWRHAGLAMFEFQSADGKITHPSSAPR